jgi:undecaprenyl-diphosphatase
MGILEAILIGIIQGLTEFLPVSSSGHIELSKAILGTNIEGEENVLFTVVLHAATALSTIIIFRKEITQIFKGLLMFTWNDEFKFSLRIIISMFPAAIVGVVFKDEIDHFFTGQIMLVGFMLLITGIVLFLADKAKNTTKDVSILQAVIIGIAQAIAILPGISRSGATIGTSVLLGIDRTKAAKFSFLMVVPLIFGKMAKLILDGDISFQSNDFLAYGVGFLSAFLVGLLACTWMIALVKKSQLKYFSFYCFIIGIIAIVHAAI